MKFSFHIQDENFVDPLAPSNVFLKVPDRAGAPVDVFAANLNICKHEGHWMGPGGFVWEKLKSANMKDIGWGQGVSYERNWKKHCPPWSTKNPNEISDRAPAHQTPQILRRLNWFLKKNHDSSLNSRNFRISRIFVDWASRKSAKNREKIKIQIVNTDFSRLLKNPRSLFGFWLFLDFLRFFSMPSPENPAGGRKAPPPEPFPLPKSSKWSQSLPVSRYFA